MEDPTKYSIAAQVLALRKYGGVSPRLFDALFVRLGSLENILTADEGALRSIEGMTVKAAKQVVKGAKSLAEAARYVEDLRSREIELKTRFDTDFPTLLFELNDPPPLLYLKGKLPDANAKSVALVGTPKATTQGIEMTARLAKTFAENKVQVVSTMRGGIDSAAHLGCRAGGGTSYAVLDSGFDYAIDEDTVRMAIDTAHAGGVISEYEPGQKPDIESIQASNRVIVGLSQAVVVTEFYFDSIETLDLLNFCNMIGKMLFVMVEPELGAFSDEKALGKAVECGAIPMEGYERIHDIIRVLV